VYQRRAGIENGPYRFERLRHVRFHLKNGQIRDRANDGLTKMTEPIQIRERVGDRLLVLFDGQCGLCNRAVRWLMRRDRWYRLRFAPSGSAMTAGLIERHRADAASWGPESGKGPSTILVVSDLGAATEQVLARSEAVLALLNALPQPWKALGAVLGWIPRPLRDAGYRLIARWRHRIWGRLEICPVLSDEERERFL
jgi:predicted DCC family thiol-disulfide oxidoreductase YuxK